MAPEDGKANAAVIALLAKELGVAKSALAITAGQKARLKTIALAMIKIAGTTMRRAGRTPYRAPTK